MAEAQAMTRELYNSLTAMRAKAADNGNRIPKHLNITKLLRSINKGLKLTDVDLKYIIK